MQKTVTYAYDAGGNIICRTEYPFTLKETAYLENGVAFPYVYPATGWRDQLLSYNGEQCTYDALGNPTIYRGKTLQWSHGRQLDAYDNIATYTYNANGIRTSKTVHGSTTKFYLNGNQIIAQDNGNKIIFNYGIDGINGFTLKLSDLVVQHYTYKKNLQGDIIGIYDQSNTLICKYIYDAWGNHKILVLNNGVYEELNSTNTSTNASIAMLNPFRYRGYYFDIETGLYYLNSRYYDPQTGRFINADDICNIDTDNLNGLNLYMYCANNPIINLDDNGNAWWNPFSWNWKKIGEKIVTIIAVTASVAAVAGGVALTIVSGGALANVGSALIGAGVGSILGGIQNQMSGGSFWSGYLGGAISGGVTGLGISFGIGGALVGGFLGNFAGTITTDAINGTQMDSYYFRNLFTDSLLSGIVAVGGKYLGDAINLLNIPGYRDIYTALIISAEFISVDIFNKTKALLNNITDYLRDKFSRFFRRY